MLPKTDHSSLRLELEPQSDARLTAVLSKSGGPSINVSFEGVTKRLKAPEHLDGFVAAVLPELLRTNCTVHVAGTLTREIVRNLVDAGKGWEDWNFRRYRAFRISADRIIDPPVPTFRPRAAFAWSGSLRSTHTLMRHHAHIVPGGVHIARIVHVIGLQGDTLNIPVEAIAAEVSRHSERFGATAECVETNARERSLVEAEAGVSHIVAAALHLAATDLQLAFHGRRWPLSAQLRYPRPEPVFPDMFSGSRLAIRADGGAATPTRMVREIRDHAPSLLAAISGCSERSRFTPPCGACSGCIVTSLAFAGAGAVHQALPAPTEFAIEALDWNDPIVAAEATEIVSDWSAPRSPVYRALRGRVKRDQRNTASLEMRRWVASATGRGPVWPR